MEKLTVSITANDLIAEMVSENERPDILDFISSLVDYVEGYGFDFRDEVVKRLEEDK